MGYEQGWNYGREMLVEGMEHMFAPPHSQLVGSIVEDAIDLTGLLK